MPELSEFEELNILVSGRGAQMSIPPLGPILVTYLASWEPEHSSALLTMLDSCGLLIDTNVRLCPRPDSFYFCPRGLP